MRGGALRTRVEVAPAQGAIPGILRFGTREHGLRGGKRDTQSWVGGGAWPLGSPSGPNLGLSFPWPCPLPLLDASGREEEPKGGARYAALLGAGLPYIPVSVSLQVLSAGAPSRAGARVCFCLTPGLMHVCISLSLPIAGCPQSLSPLFPWLCHPVPISACLAGGGAHGSSISAFVGLCLSLRLQVPFFRWGVAVGVEDSALSPPLHP